MMMTRRFLATTAILTIAAVPAFAQKPASVDAGSYDSLRDPNWSPNVATEKMVMFEDDFEAYTVGSLVPQGGWSTSFSANANVIEGGNAIDGKSGQHTADASNVSDTIDSPTFAVDFGLQNASLYRVGNGALYQVITIDSNTGTFNTRVNLETDGRITVGQVNAAQTAFEFIDSGATWAPDTVFSIAIETTDAGVLNVYKDGSVIFTGQETGFVINGAAGGIGQWRVFAGNETGAPDDELIFDNLNNVAGGGRDFNIPTASEYGLGALALLILAAGALVIRRRA